MNVEVSIIIVNYKLRGLTRECIKDIDALSLPFSYEIIVVDNEGDRELESLLSKRFPHVSYIALPDNPGLSVANNVGVRAARGEFVLMLNPDITVCPGSIEKLKEVIVSDSKIGIVAPRLLNPDKTTQQSYYRFYNAMTPFYRRTFLGKTSRGRADLERVLMKDVDWKTLRDVEWILGASFMMRRSFWEEIGGMDERFKLYFEDVDLCKRVYDRGMAIRYIPDATMIHLHARESADTQWIRSLFNPVTRIHIKSAIQYFMKHGTVNHSASQ